MAGFEGESREELSSKSEIEQVLAELNNANIIVDNNRKYFERIIIMISVNTARNSRQDRIIEIAKILNNPIDNSLKDNITDLKNDEHINVCLRKVVKNFITDNGIFSRQNEKEIAEELKKQYEEGEWKVEITEENLNSTGEGIAYSLHISIKKKDNDMKHLEMYWLIILNIIFPAK